MNYINDLAINHCELEFLKPVIEKAVDCIVHSYKNGGKVITCGNGGSASDSEHIVAELLKSFLKKRVLTDELCEKIDAIANENLSKHLQMSLPAISLVGSCAIQTAIINDLGADVMFAQQVLGLANKGDILIGISTSGNSKNVCNALYVAKAKGVTTIALTGNTGGELRNVADILINAPSDYTPRIQEYHLAIYHTICAQIEENLFEL